jgi:malate synthase
MPSVVYEYQKKYTLAWLERNKDKIKEHNTEKIKCYDCNKNICRYSMLAHKKSKKHIFNTTGVKILRGGQPDPEQIKSDTIEFLSAHISMAGLALSSDEENKSGAPDEVEPLWI